SSPRKMGEGDFISMIDLGAQRRRMGDRIELAWARVLDHGMFVMGPEVERLELALSARLSVPHAISCASGTDALLVTFLALGLGPGDAVFVPSFTFAAAAEAAKLCGATPVFVDFDPRTFNIDASSVERAARATSLRPAVVVAVDMYGQPA